jgi:hypothetical protein
MPCTGTERVNSEDDDDDDDEPFKRVDECRRRLRENMKRPLLLVAVNQDRTMTFCEAVGLVAAAASLGISMLLIVGRLVVERLLASSSPSSTALHPLVQRKHTGFV